MKLKVKKHVSYESYFRMVFNSHDLDWLQKKIQWLSFNRKHRYGVIKVHYTKRAIFSSVFEKVVRTSYAEEMVSEFLQIIEKCIWKPIPSVSHIPLSVCIVK